MKDKDPFIHSARIQAIIITVASLMIAAVSVEWILAFW